MPLIVMVCGHHGHCLWPSCFVAVIVKPQVSVIWNFVEIHISRQNYFGWIAKFGEENLNHNLAIMISFDLQLCPSSHKT